MMQKTPRRVYFGGRERNRAMDKAVWYMALSREQLHRVIDHLPDEKLPALADLIDKLIEEDDESVSDSEIAEYKRIREAMRAGDFYTFHDVFGDN